ncbi:MAG: CvpA family protein [Acetobacterium woodii]|nr:CvpA family protein [Acetobacterium woodii]
MSFSALTSLDFICILICLFSGILGYKRGAINTLISFGGFIASFVIAWLFSAALGEWLINAGVFNSLFATINVDGIAQSLIAAGIQQNDLMNSVLGAAIANGGQSVLDQGVTAIADLIKQSIAQSISFGIIVIGVSVLCWILQIIFIGITKLPVIGTVNRLIGLLLGLILGVAVVAVMLWVFSIINLSTGGAANLPSYQNSYLIEIGTPYVNKYMGIQ